MEHARDIETKVYVGVLGIEFISKRGNTEEAQISSDRIISDCMVLYHWGCIHANKRN